MSFIPELIHYGVIKVEPRKVKLFQNSHIYVPIQNFTEDVIDARWTGDNVVVYLKSGKIRKYTSPSVYVPVMI